MCSVPAASHADSGAGYPRDDSSYLYELTPETVSTCALLQKEFSLLKKDSDAEWSRRHMAMSLTWQQLLRTISPEDLDPMAKLASEEAALSATLAKQADPAAYLAEQSRVCEIVATIHSETFNGATLDIEDTDPELFAGYAAKKNQSGLDEFPEPPTKTLTFGDWNFEAKGNSCIATHTFDDGAVLQLGLTNFFDGALRFTWDGLPELDAESEEGADEYEVQMARHRAGSAFDDDYNTIMAEGVTFENYPGTALFVDDKLIAGPAGEGASHGQRYIFGPYMQSNYYNMLPLGTEIRVKVLGKDTHSVKIDDPAMWNEISNCMAQYPYG
ncbi:hypothetical protein [Pontixanthobacter aquaemixtae]|uniref:Uncharacterized protein n=1 Tax=Pontixanthobacter aquaemixtae TaxID=1958940 RepID=A0A844ZTI4_9SPHN|nr:hypothetical protein [Pontixanthobacter aquaemixtae]MXO91243.1 hypothetical protein [Pontixanthobacter aquaemixtae]